MSTETTEHPAPQPPSYGVLFNSPFYLHPSDHPGLRICPVDLKGENYEEWSSSMLNSLRAKRKIGFVTGAIVQPEDSDPLLEDWYTVNSMLVGWLVQSIDVSLRPSITYFSTVKELWDDLKQRFSVGNGPRKSQLRHEIATWRQEGKTISAYYNHLKQLWDELATYVPPQRCTCTGCSCNITAAIIKEREEERTHQFLIGLDDAFFSSMRSNILAQETLPPLGRVYSLAVQEERLKLVVSSRSSSDSHAFAAREYSGVSKNTKVSDKSALQCTQNLIDI